MKFEIAFDRVFPHPPERVWRAITDADELGQWLMETDFVAEEGRAFTMRCDDADGGEDVYACKVLELEPGRRMLWSWVLDGRQGDGETRVEFVLTPVDGGTRLTITHSGDRDRETIEAFKGGWPTKLEAIDGVLAS